MDIVIPIREATHNDYAELRFALRSFEKFVPHTDIVLIGAKPKWFKNGRSFAFTESPDPKYREANIFRKLEWYVNKHNDGSEFIYANDDHFVLQPWTGLPPYPVKDSLTKSITSRSSIDPYVKSIKNTASIVGHDEYDYDVHAPMCMDPELFKECFAGVDWTKPWGYLLKTLYGRHFDYTCTTPDYKINEPIAPSAFHNFITELEYTEQPFFSTSDKAFDFVMMDILISLFPDPSKYENA